MSVQIKQANNRKTMNDFVAFPRYLYKNSKEYIPEMESDVRDFFNPEKNNSLNYAEIQPFVAYRNGKCVGRVAAIISYRANTKWNKKNVRFTYLDFIDDKEVSGALLSAVEKWGKKRGMTDCEGPMGITDFDKEGMLIEDFHLGGGTMEFWNYPYYVEHMRYHGYDKAVDWLQARIKVPKEVPAKYARVAKLSKEMFNLRVVKKSKKEVREEWGYKIFRLFNDAFAPLYGTSVFSKDQIDNYLKQYLSILDLELVPLILNEKDELVGAAVTVRDLSPALNKSQGRLFPFGWFHLSKALIRKNADKAQLMLIAVRPDMQGLGLNALFFDDLIPIYNRVGIKWCETNPQLETNVKELSQWKPLNPEMVKRRRCWQKRIK